MSEQNPNEYAVIMKSTGKIMDSFWANAATADAKAKNRGWDLRKVNVVKIYPTS